MLKRYQDFITESLSRVKRFNYVYDRFIEIYNTQIVPKIGEVDEFKNHMLSGVLSKQDEDEFHRLRKDLINLRNDFAEKILSFPKFYQRLFSSLAHGTSDPEEDFEEMQKLMNRTGYDLDVIKKLFDPIVSIFISEDFKNFIEKNSLDSQNGYIDIYLYKINEKLNLETKVWLGGEGWASTLTDGDHDEYIVKYAYGYHKTKYGQLVFEQAGISREDFIIESLEHLKDHMKSDVFPTFVEELRRSHALKFEIYEGDNYIICDDDRFIINYDDIYSDFIKFDEINKELPIEEFKKILISSLNRETYSLPNLNFQDTGDEIIIS